MGDIRPAQLVEFPVGSAENSAELRVHRHDIPKITDHRHTDGSLHKNGFKQATAGFKFPADLFKFDIFYQYSIQGDNQQEHENHFNNRVEHIGKHRAVKMSRRVIHSQCRDNFPRLRINNRHQRRNPSTPTVRCGLTDKGLAL
ncbi:hypothetical protein SDC9_185449 [bioreactor metagenome]|uniref:Uncharacterized protein n=1 Tax=bioreactor metagenome TaxID=1076179 RepID=A0A645HFW7_9ZZZZ